MDAYIKILNISSAFTTFATGLFAPLYAVFVQHIGGSTFVAGTAYSIYAIAAGSLIYLVGRWEDDAASKETLVMMGALIQTIGFAGYLFVHTALQLFVVQAILGISIAVHTPAFDGLYSKHLDDGRYASEWGIWEAMYWVVTGISAIIGGYIVTVHGFRTLFVIMTALSASATGVTIHLIRRRSNQ